MIIWYLSQCVASWRSLSWKGLGQRWLWSQVWLSDWWTGSPVAACGHTGVSVAGPVSSQVEGVGLEGKTGQMHHLTSILHDMKLPSFSNWLQQLIVLQLNRSSKFTLYVVPGSSLWYRWKTGTLMVLVEGSTPDEAVNLSLITRPLLEGGRGGVESARLDWDFKPNVIDRRK